MSRTTKTPGATETTAQVVEITPVEDQQLDVLGEAFAESPTSNVPTLDVGSAETAQPNMPTPGEMWETIQLLKQQLAAQQPQQAQKQQAKAVAPNVPTSEASASNGRWVLTNKGWAIKGDV
ncbi:hypothetical protein [Acinetobacter sp.]|uniref:hypothetical protein n=1 Tax=Acinetobacter sp. TaxID=472 RepID=UPI00388E95A2